jgi:hypothetical protein
MGLEWHEHSGGKWYAMLPVTLSRPIRRGGTVSNLYVFGRVEPDKTGQLVASATSFDHIKYVGSVAEGKQHVEAIWALEYVSGT